MKFNSELAYRIARNVANRYLKGASRKDFDDYVQHAVMYAYKYWDRFDETKGKEVDHMFSLIKYGVKNCFRDNPICIVRTPWRKRNLKLRTTSLSEHLSESGNSKARLEIEIMCKRLDKDEKEVIVRMLRDELAPWKVFSNLSHQGSLNKVNKIFSKMRGSDTKGF